MGKKGKRRKAQRRKDKQNEEMNKMSYPNNYKTTTTTTWKAPKPACHTGQNKVFTTTGGIDVYAGGRNRSGGWWVMHPAPDLAIGPDETMSPSYSKSASTIVPEGWSCDQFIGRTDPPKYMIEMDFPDFGVPKVDDYFWYALHDDILEYGIKSISTQCAGGHGRTGVQLAILYYLLNDDDVKASITDAAQLILLIRDLHCSHAVETNEQQRYIARVLDIPVGESLIVETKWGGYSWPTGGDKGKANPTIGATLAKTTTVGTGYNLNEKWDMTPKPANTKPLVMEDEFDKCECCDEHDYSLYDDFCFNCGWQLPDDVEQLKCLHCDTNKHSWEFLSPKDESCMSCLAKENNIYHSITKVFCSGCKSMREMDMVGEFINGGFLCLACEANTPATKEVKE